MGYGGVFGAALGGLGGIASSEIGANAAKQHDELAARFQQQALDLQKNAADQWGQLNVPNLQYTPYSWLQDYTPETYNADIENMTQMTPDTANAAQVEDALTQLGQFAKGGLQPADLATLQQIQRQQAGAGNSNIQATIDNLRSRGEGGSGAELAARLSGDQSAADNANGLYTGALQTALQRQLAAIQGQGTLAQSEQTTQNQTQQAMAGIANQFNEDVMGLRTQAAADAANTRNAAQQFNIQGKQGISQANIDQAHAIQQQNFSNQTAKTAGFSNALEGQATGNFAASAAQGLQANAAQQNATANVGAVLQGAKTGAQIATNPSGSIIPTRVTGNNGTTPATNTNTGLTPDEISTLQSTSPEELYRGGPVKAPPVDHRALAALAQYASR